MTYRIQKLGVGGIVDQSFVLVTSHFFQLLQLLMFAQIPLLLFLAAYLSVSLPSLTVNQTPEERARHQQSFLIHVPVVVAVQVLNLVVVVPLTTGAITHAIASAYVGNSVSAVRSMRFAMKRALPLIGTTLLLLLSICAGIILLIAPGVLVGLYCALSLQVAAIEDRSGFAAMSRSWKLVASSGSTLVLLIIVLILIQFLGSVVSGLLPPGALSVSSYLLLICFDTMFASTFMAVYYFSCRTRIEKVDLDRLASGLR